MAWWGLANIKTLRLEPSDVERMRRALQDANASDDDRIATGFALAKALEDDGRLAEALRALAQANDIARRRRGWNAATFSAGIDTMMKAFAASSTIAETPERGFDVVFIVGLPRSGTTLVEQIPASHSKIENEYTRTFEDLARFWRDFDRIANRWTALHPSHVYQHECEALIAGPERGIRKLLDFCRLPFDESCLRFHETNRDVRSPSATQVRQPLRSDTARGQRHGALLDPLRVALGLPLFETYS